MRTLCAILLIGFVLFLPAVRSPFFLDDFLQGAMVEGTFPAKRGMLELYDFIDDTNRSALTERGLLPWWTDPSLTLRFFRPLASAILYGEHKVFGHSALPMHLHSLAWWIAATLAVHSLYKRVLDRRPRLLATAMFALSPCHSLPLAWLANRETLVSLTFGALAIGAQWRWREERRARDGVLAATFFALALLGGGEYALCCGGYVVAMDLVRREPVARRATGWLPFVAPAAGYLVVRGMLHYGTAGSGYYSDPLHDPSAFLANAPMRAMLLLGSGWMGFDPETWRHGVMRGILTALVLSAALLLVLPLRLTLERQTPAVRKAATWLLMGSFAALVPVLAVVTARRLLGASMIGVAPIVALLVERAWFPTDEEDARSRSVPGAAIALAALGLGFAHLVHGPATSWLVSQQHRKDAEDFHVRVDLLRSAMAESPNADVALARGLAGAFFAPFALDPLGRTPPRWSVLTHAGHVLVRRVDERTLELVVPKGRCLYPVGERNLYRSPKMMRVGTILRAPGYTVTILENGDLGPRHARFTFDAPLDSKIWFADDFDALRSIDLPDVGFGLALDPRGDKDKEREKEKDR
ncbi:MAG: glycosyltransferase family 39 protein [Deltaproteobacteria bacterium]|nr:glycosyltransferase family 39 protein [Deltaproteobacteria bacterium]